MRIGIVFLIGSVLFCGSAAAQQAIPSDRERHHKVVFENAEIRILDGRIAPHDTTPEHTHSANAVVVFLSASTFGIRTAGQQPTLTRLKPGDLRYVNYGDKPVSHMVWNDAASSFHFLVVELKKRAVGAGGCPAPVVAGIRELWRRPMVAAYDWRVSGGQPARFPGQRCAWLLIDITRDGRFQFFPAGARVGAQEGGRYILLQL